MHITNKRQSPVDIRSDVVCVDPDVCRVETLTFTYLPGDCTGLVTTKGGWKVNAKSQSVLHGSHLPANGDYRLAQFHAHWGSNAHCGSEHLLDGRSMSGEVHFVFWNQAYGTFEKAVEHDDGLAVLGVFIKEGKTSKAYAPLIESIEKALATDGSAPVPANLDVDALLPHSRDFVTYLGSLTTPPYAESVIWTVLTEPVQLGAHQLAVFRRICEANFRPCQALCERKLLSSNKAAITA